jgi:hexosaminidase
MLPIAILVASCGPYRAPFNGSSTLLWPRPASLKFLPPASGGERSVGIMPALFKFQAVNASGPPGATITAPPSLQAAFDRYFSATFPAASGEICGYLLPSLDVAVADLTERPPREGDDESYALEVPNSGDPATLRAPTLTGALRGLETFSQLVGLNAASAQYGIAAAPLSIRDAPAYPHRGLMLDSGRRFIPVAAVKMLLSGMEASKLNVLHLHASDECRFGVESKLFPALTAGLTGDQGGFYTQADVAELVAYARARAIRIVPEFDLPGHARGLLPLAASGDLLFCTNGSAASQLFHDPAGRTLGTLKALLGEMAALFAAEQVLNIGADETGRAGVCGNVSLTYGLELDVAAHVGVLGRDVQGWEELLFNAAAPGGAALPNGTIIAAWSRHRAADVVAEGFRAIEAHNKFFYLNKFARAPATPWVDIGEGVRDADRHLLLGGEMSMWTDGASVAPLSRSCEHAFICCFADKPHNAPPPTHTQTPKPPNNRLLLHQAVRCQRHGHKTGGRGAVPAGARRRVHGKPGRDDLSCRGRRCRCFLELRHERTTGRQLDSVQTAHRRAHLALAGTRRGGVPQRLRMRLPQPVRHAVHPAAVSKLMHW